MASTRTRNLSVEPPIPSRTPIRLADAPDWHESAPARVVQARSWEEGTLGWQAWKKHLRRRRTPLPLEELLSKSERTVGPPLSWGLHAELALDDAGELIRLSHGLARGRKLDRDRVVAAVRNWLAEAPLAEANFPWALSSLAWAHALPALSQRLIAEIWWQLLEYLLSLVAENKLQNFSNDPRVDLAIGAELPLTLAYQLGEIWPCRVLTDHAREVLAQTVSHFVDEQGMMGAGQQRLADELLASWSRCRLLAAALDKKTPWPEEIEQRWQLAWQHALRMRRRDGSARFSPDPADPRALRWLAAMIARFGDRSTRRLAELVLSQAATTRSIARPLPTPSCHSEMTRAAVMRTDWSRRSATLAVDYYGPSVRLELEHRGELIFAGDWSVEVRHLDKRLRPTRAWESVLWVSDEDVDYLELATSLGDDVTLERQVLLAREDGFLFLADSLLGPENKDLAYGSRLALAEEMGFEPARETCEGMLVGRKRTANVLPLALPEWRSDRRGGSLSADAGHLELRQHSPAGRLYAPLWIDFDSHRQRKPLTWRQLTVGENRQIVSGSRAAGFRVQVGTHQWLIYRSLTGEANRTVLGQNLIHEFLCARFLPSGTTRMLLGVDHDDD